MKHILVCGYILLLPLKNYILYQILSIIFELIGTIKIGQQKNEIKQVF